MEMETTANHPDYMLRQYHDYSWQVVDITTGLIVFTAWSKKAAQHFIIMEKMKPSKYVTYVDPPSGWSYGFPKALPNPPPLDIKEWLIEQGYPRHLTEKSWFYVRYIHGPDQKVEDSA